MYWEPAKYVARLRTLKTEPNPLLQRGQHLSPHLRQHFVVARGRIRYQVMQRLVHAPNIVRGQARRHRLDTLALSGQ